MWPFKSRDYLRTDVDLSKFAPFAEAERYLLVFPVGVGVHYVLVVVYEARSGKRVHVAHSPGLRLGGGMENFVEWIATGVRRRDSRAIALLTSWPTDFRNDDELTRSHFGGRRSRIASPSKTVLLGEHGEVQNMLTRDQECFYRNASFCTRLSAGEWSRILGAEVVRFTEAEWQEAADLVDPDRSIRDAAEREAEHQHSVHDAFLKEMGVYYSS